MNELKELNDITSEEFPKLLNSANAFGGSLKTGNLTKSTVKKRETHLEYFTPISALNYAEEMEKEVNEYLQSKKQELQEKVEEIVNKGRNFIENHAEERGATVMPLPSVVEVGELNVSVKGSVLKAFREAYTEAYWKREFGETRPTDEGSSIGQAKDVEPDF